MTTSWDAVLEDFAARLVEQRAALDAGQPDSVPPFDPPAAMPSLPPALRGRAEALLDGARELQAEMAASLAATTRGTRIVRRFAEATAAPRPAASYMDDVL